MALDEYLKHFLFVARPQTIVFKLGLDCVCSIVACFTKQKGTLFCHQSFCRTLPA